MGAYQSITEWLERVVYSLVSILVGWIASHLNWLLVRHPFSVGLRLSILASGSFSVSKVALICCSWFPALRNSSKKPENSPSGLRWHLLWAVQLISCSMGLSFSFGSQEAISGDREKQWSIYLMDRSMWHESMPFSRHHSHCQVLWHLQRALGCFEITREVAITARNH